MFLRRSELFIPHGGKAPRGLPKPRSLMIIYLMGASGLAVRPRGFLVRRILMLSNEDKHIRLTQVCSWEKELTSTKGKVDSDVTGSISCLVHMRIFLLHHMFLNSPLVSHSTIDDRQSFHIKSEPKMAPKCRSCSGVRANVVLRQELRRSFVSRFLPPLVSTHTLYSP